MRILALDDLPLLPGDMDATEALADGGRLDADDPEVVTLSTSGGFQARDLERWPSLKHVAVCGTSLGRLPQDALAERGITISNVTDYGDHPVAEMLLAQLVFCARGVGGVTWREGSHELSGMRMTIVGLGMLGRSIAELAMNFGIEVSYVSRSAKSDMDATGARHVALRDALPDADMVVLTGPTDVQLMGADEFALLRPDAALAQMSIGHAMDTDAFRRWLDVPTGLTILDPLVDADARAACEGHDRAIIWPIVSGMSHESYARLGMKYLANLRALSL